MYSLFLWLASAMSLLSLSYQDPVPRGEPVRHLKVAGSIKSPSGAAVPGATVEIKDPATGERLAAVAGEDGRYVIPNVKPGTYDVVVSSAGFARVEKRIHVELPLAAGSPPGTKVLDLVLGGPVPIGDPIPGARTGKFESSQMSFQNDLDLQRWLDAQLQAGKRVQSIIPVAAKISIFVLAEIEQDVSVSQIVLFVNEPLDPNRLGERVNQHPDKRLAGVHRLGANSYLMVLVHESRKP